jgi:hypothetical protein
MERGWGVNSKEFGMIETVRFERAGRAIIF